MGAPCAFYQTAEERKLAVVVVVVVMMSPQLQCPGGALVAYPVHAGRPKSLLSQRHKVITNEGFNPADSIPR